VRESPIPWLEIHKLNFLFEVLETKVFLKTQMPYCKSAVYKLF
jgi:hypothetical protein